MTGDPDRTTLCINNETNETYICGMNSSDNSTNVTDA